MNALSRYSGITMMELLQGQRQTDLHITHTLKEVSVKLDVLIEKCDQYLKCKVKPIEVQSNLKDRNGNQR